ncbi:hypothetical protein HYH02_009562 [Chlamydomonas schloesseri]|uniref:Uncharacterized protein n=1 Tax=Chlamydomonas schloesseri TaxID=2026947 RepID=A0A835TPW2_9CHLO|nr:hypothetical protein HYH02_009562 [Chlamydomonas schloesseri]|eukprot:KAG2443151.1 hypothetical protein HYH02_009562 [Chlamydomonas schloesseri]
MQKHMLLHALLAVLLAVLPASAQDDAGCADTMKGSCGACGICCCYKGPLRYVPDDDTCTCKIEYGASFIVMIVMAVLVCIASLVGGSYFGGSHKLSPYPRSDVYSIGSSR